MILIMPGNKVCYKVFLELYNWTMFPLVTLIEKIYDKGRIALNCGDHSNLLLVELASIAEHALKYMHTGNTAVIATSIMNSLWIGRSIV